MLVEFRIMDSFIMAIVMWLVMFWFIEDILSRVSLMTMIPVIVEILDWM